jgi:hypothetical protein
LPSKLRAAVLLALHNLTAAQKAGLRYSAYLHRKNLQTLLDTASEHGIDTETWLDPTILLSPELRRRAPHAR